MAQAGYLEHNVGLFVAAILNKPEVSTPAKIAFAQSETISMEEVLKIWSEVTGKRVTWLQCSVEEYEQIYGVYGKEIGAQWALFGGREDGKWDAKHEGQMISTSDLGLDGKLMGLKEAFEKDKERL